MARAVLFAAHAPRRDITAGGFGVGAVLGDMLASALLDWAMKVIDTTIQQTDQPPPRDTADNLWSPRSDGHIASDQLQYIRRQSLWLETQMHPGRAVAITATGAGIIAALMGRRK